MPATTIDAIATSFRTAIQETTPRIVEGQASRAWKYAESANMVPRSSARWFWFEWDDEGHTPGGFMGPARVDTTVTLSIMVDYGGIPRERVKVIAADDRHQLRDVLNRLKDAATGLLWVEMRDWAFVNADPNQARVALQYEVRYMKARA